jgi:hypothetical protein
MLAGARTIAQPIESQGNKKVSAIMQGNMLVSRSQSSQSSTSLRATRLPVRGTLGSSPLGPTELGIALKDWTKVPKVPKDCSACGRATFGLSVQPMAMPAPAPAAREVPLSPPKQEEYDDSRATHKLSPLFEHCTVVTVAQGEGDM